MSVSVSKSTSRSASQAMTRSVYKQVYELDLVDFQQFPVWYFPLNDRGRDDLSVTPYIEGDPMFSIFQVLVFTDFVDKDGVHYPGYLYWNGENSVDILQPTLFARDGSKLSFWHGVKRPAWQKVAGAAAGFQGKFPIHFESQMHFGLMPKKGTLLGLYFLDETNLIACV